MFSYIKYILIVNIFAIFQSSVSTFEHSQQTILNTNEYNEKILKDFNQLKNLLDLHDDDQILQLASNRTRNEIPQFMLETYENLLKEKETSPIFKTHYVSRIISVLEDLNDNILSVSGYFKFQLNTSIYSSNEDLVKAELHVYRLPIKMDIQFISPLLKYPHYLLKVYQVIDKENIHNPDLQILLNVHIINIFNPEWTIFNIKHAVESWISGEKPNFGLLVVATNMFGQQIPIEFIRRSSRQKVLQPILVLYNGKLIQSQKDNITNITEPQTRFPRRSSLDDFTNSTNNTNNITDTNLCTVRPFYIDFAKLGWNQWIIAPPGYNANICSGECTLKIQANLTNYSIVRLLYLQLNSHDKTVPKPCCVPHTYGSIAILYMKDERHIVLYRLKNMSIKSCICE